MLRPKVIMHPYLVHDCRLVKRPDTRQIVSVWLAKTATANASEIMLLSARPVISRDIMKMRFAICPIYKTWTASAFELTTEVFERHSNLNKAGGAPARARSIWPGLWVVVHQHVTSGVATLYFLSICALGPMAGTGQDRSNQAQQHGNGSVAQLDRAADF